MKLSELEIKLQIPSEELFNKTIRMCMDLSKNSEPIILQKDEYFDTSDRHLKQQDLTVRIRTVNGRKIIALKSPRVHLSSGMTDRIELEFLSDAEADVSCSLIAQGLKPFETIEKKRSLFILNDCEIAFDQLPFIGFFIEIEGKNESSIQEMISLLQLENCSVVSKNYGELMLDKFNELNLSTANLCATFEEEIKIKSNSGYK